MSQLLNRFEVCDALVRLIEEANEQLILISPYIKLNPHLKQALLKHSGRKGLKLIIVYGKNEEDKRLSVSDNDLEFFKSFHNVEIRYHKRLHAKMYANEVECLITSMNLHDYSYKNNIEVGVLTKFKLLDFVSNMASTFTSIVKQPLESQAQDFADYIVSKGTLEYAKSPKEEKSFFGLKTSYSESEVLVNKQRTGFCIRTKSVIPFNTKRPYSDVAYESWSRYNNKKYVEKYCHQCGRSHSTSMEKPVCLDCFSKS